MANQENLNVIKFMMASGEFHDEEQATKVLKASLQALRDRLPKIEAYHLGTQLKEPLRHSYFEGWKNNKRQTLSINKSEFLAEVHDHLKGFEDHSLSDLVPVALEAVLYLLQSDEAQKVKDVIPKSMHDIFSGSQSME